MDFTNFINSKDIRDYHREIGYQYNALEAAWLVSQCQSIPLWEKHEAWQWIIDNMPDYEITNVGYRHPLKGESLHKMLADYMKMQNQFIIEFKNGTGGWFYSYTSHYNNNSSCESYFYEGFFSGWDKCVKNINASEDADYDFIYATVRRFKPDEEYKISRFYGNIDVDIMGQVMDVSPGGFTNNNERWSLLDGFFDELWFEFPVPFKKGDIVWLKSLYRPEESDPIVLTGIIIPPWSERDKYLEKRRKGGDTSDMNIWGYAADMEWHNGYYGVYSEVWWNYMDVEYYRKELSGVERVLKPISNWLKGEFRDDLCLLLSAYHQIMSDVAVSKMTPAGFMKEGLKLAGLPVEED